MKARVLLIAVLVVLVGAALGCARTLVGCMGNECPCDGPGTCRPECEDDGEPCEVVCDPSGGCSVDCGDNASCLVDAKLAEGDVTVDCGTSGRCEVDCRGAEWCEVDCADAASCGAACDADNCVVHGCDLASGDCTVLCALGEEEPVQDGTDAGCAG